MSGGRDQTRVFAEMLAELSVERRGDWFDRRRLWKLRRRYPGLLDAWAWITGP